MVRPQATEDQIAQTRDEKTRHEYPLRPKPDDELPKDWHEHNLRHVSDEEHLYEIYPPHHLHTS